jgi:oxygen-independent coproporphyrinogen-3 oxidase
MTNTVLFDGELIKRYNVQGPRYTSYPTALSFGPDFGADDYRSAAEESNSVPIPAPLSLYVHVPFCETLCYYCGCNKIVTRHREKCSPYLDRVIAEARMHAGLYDADRKVDQLHFGGGTPTYFDDNQLRTLMAALGDAFNFDDPAKREFSIEIDPRTVDPQRIKALADIGFNRLSFGIQDFDPKVQLAINRVQSFEQTAKVIEASRDNGFGSVSVDLIYGLPFQNVKTFNQTLEMVGHLRPDRISVYNYAHLPDRFRAQRLIQSKDLPSAEEKLALLDLTVNQLTASGYEYIGMDHFALPGDELVSAQREGSLQRNFQGYSTRAHSDLIGLGVSAISHVGPSFNQSVTRLTDYDKAIDAGELPIHRGTWMNLDDQIRADVISHIMCRSELRFANIESSWEIDFEEYFDDELTRLKPMEDDGLLRQIRGGFSITPTGRMLLRNIAMVFDAYLSASQKSSPRFSKVI